MNRYLLPAFISLVFALVFTRLVHFYVSRPTYKAGMELSVVTRIATEPKISGRIQRFSIRLPDGDYVSVTTTKFPIYRLGESITVSGTLKESGEEKKFFTLGYPDIMIQPQKQGFFLSLVYAIRQDAISKFDRRLSPEHAGLLSGVVLGIKRDMPEGFIAALRTAGVMHVIAASGMNVTMVSGAIFFLLQKLLSRKKALLVSIIGIVFYAGLAGFEPSIVRASIMGSIVFTAAILGRQKSSLYALFLTGMGMLMISPALLEDVGFQLSFLATGGIVLLQPMFAGLTKQRWALFSSDLTTTLAAQLATVPILLGTFGEFNLLSVAVNVLILWTVPILMVLGAAGILLSLFIEPVGGLVIYFTYPFLWYFETVIRFFADKPVQIRIDFMPVGMTVGYYLCLVAVVWYVRKKSKKRQQAMGSFTKGG